MTLRQVHVELLYQQFKNLDQVGIGQRAEDDHFIQTVQELGVECLLHFLPDQVLNFLGNHFFPVDLEAETLALHQVPCADVGRHHDDHVFEVHGVAQPVSKLAVFQDLQQDVEHIRMRLFDFVQQNHGVGRTLHPLSELAAFFVANISRRRADQLADGVLLHELGHIEANQRLFAAKQELRQRARDFRFAHTGWSEEQE